MEWIHEGDAVFRGGGVKGLGLAGALMGFAEHPTKPVTKWVNLAGASAGAIIASYLACGHTASEMIDLLSDAPFASFQDFPFKNKFFGGGRNLLFRHGLAPGKVFRKWFSQQLDGATFSAVRAESGGYHLKLIATDVTNKDLLVLPTDLSKYALPGSDNPIDPDQFEIADAARMSMSIPYFFEPVQLLHLETGLLANIVDGGVLSNFPVWLFDVEDRNPLRPTYGFTLKGGRGVGDVGDSIVARMPWVVRFGFDMFHTSQQAWDRRFQSHSTRVRSFAVDADDVGTTDFNLPKEKKDLLIANGRSAAKAFLDGFELEDYVNSFNRRIDNG
jgi:NTE family protein